MQPLILSSKNRIDSTLSWYGTADGSYPLTNMATAKFPQVWRNTPGTTNNDGHLSKFHFSLSAPARAGHAVFCRHNLGESAQIRVRAGTSRLDVDFTDDAELTAPFLTFTGGANGTRTNEYGVLVAGTCPRHEHDRRYPDNGFIWSEDLSNAAWEPLGGVFKYPDGRTVEFATAASQIRHGLPAGFLYADTYEVRAQVRLVSGNGDFVFRLFQGNTNTDSAIKTATSDWAWISGTVVVATPIAENPHFAYLQKQSAGGVLQWRKLQLRRGISNGKYRKYRKTTTQRRYQCIGAITEAAATNSLIRSSELDNAAWTKSGSVTVAANQSTAPDNTVAMDRVTATLAGSTVFQDLTLGGTTQRAASCFFRLDSAAAASASLQIQWFTGGVAQSVVCTYNPRSGAFISSSVVGTPTLRAANVKDEGNGFFRAYVIGAGTDALNTVVRTHLVVTTTGYVDLWGIQNEANFVTTHIPTTTVAVTRTVDTAQAEIVTWVPYVLNTVEGTLYHEIQTDDIPCDSTRTVSVAAIYSSAGLFQNDVISRLVYTAGTGYQVNAGAWVATANTWLSASTTVAANSVIRAAIRYRAADFQHALGGASISTSASAVPTGMNRIDLMREPSCTAYVRRVALWPTGKVSADLLSVTTTGPSAIDYDSGWDDAMQMTMAGDVPTLWGQTYPIVKTFADRAVEWVRVGFYDPGKTSTVDKFECGRVFMGKLTVQPAVNASYGLQDSWIERSTSTETEDGQMFFTERPRVRVVAFSLPAFTLAEGDKAHEMQGSGGMVEETLYLPDPDDEAKCQQYGFVGRLNKLDPLAYPLLLRRAMSFELREKR